MAQIAKMDIQTEIKSSADRFYDIFSRQAYPIPKICPDYIKNIQVLQGDWETVGSVKLWTYVAGNLENVKETVEAIDCTTKSMTCNMMEGEIMKHYKTYKSTLQVTRWSQGSLAKWTVEYEKHNEGIPYPNLYLEFLATISKAVDAYLLKV